MLESNELSWARSYILENMLPGSAIINRVTLTTNSFYEPVEGTVIAGTVACRLDPFNKQDSKQMAGERDAGRNWYRLTVPYDGDVQADDVIAVGGEDYSIIQLHEGHSESFVVRLIIAKVE